MKQVMARASTISMAISSLAAPSMPSRLVMKNTVRQATATGTMGTCGSTPWRYWAKLMAYMARETLEAKKMTM